MSDKAESTAVGAVAKILEAVASAEHQVTNLSLWQFSEGAPHGGMWGWRVVETPAPVTHGTDRERRDPETDWRSLAESLVSDLTRAGV